MEQMPFMETITQYLIETGPKGCDDEPVKLPSLGDLAKEMGVSRGKLREELIAAQAYGVVEMRPGDGTYVNAFDFYAAVRPAVVYSIACDRSNFDHFRKLRAHLEVAFWDEATRALDQDDLTELEAIVARAGRKLASKPIQIPHDEHRELHMRIFSKLGNPFVQGLLKAYWDAYEAVELHLFFELSYYTEMWNSHRAMVEALRANQGARGRDVLAQHFTILENRLQTPDR
ncbi:MAG: FadR family transcriptional regulator [Anaerolineae bacterium]|nr:FadR family transcriptional regulator [Anaerolineae bacterium]